MEMQSIGLHCRSMTNELAPIDRVQRFYYWVGSQGYYKPRRDLGVTSDELDRELRVDESNEVSAGVAKKNFAARVIP